MKTPFHRLSKGALLGAGLALLVLAPREALAQAGVGVGGVGAPTAADSLDRNISGLRAPGGVVPTAPNPLVAPTPQQSLDTSISSLRRASPNRGAVVYPRYRPPTIEQPGPAIIRNEVPHAAPLPSSGRGYIPLTGEKSPARVRHRSFRRPPARHSRHRAR